MAIEQTGLVSFSDGVTPTIVVDALGTPYTVPVQMFPEFVNDGGSQTFGGALYISINEDGVLEGTSTAKVTGVNQQLISTVGGITVPSPAAAELYTVRIRLRAAVNDFNFVDRVVSFRFVTPLMVPVDIANYGTTQEPLITQVGTEYQFIDGGGGLPTGEIVLNDGLGGIILPSLVATNFSAEAKDFLEERRSRLKKTLITIDFAPAGAVESWMRLTYTVDFTSGTPVFTRYRRQDQSSWGYFNGVAIDFMDATVDMITSTATATFLRGRHAIGPRFEALWAVGSLGTLLIDPNLVMAGGTLDISSVINFDSKSHLTQTGLTDKHVIIIGQTQTAMFMQEVPLRLQGYADVVSQDGVSNYFVGSLGGVLPSAPPLAFRYLMYPYLEIPNFTVFYDANDSFLPGPGGLTAAPMVQNIRIFVDGALVASQTYADVTVLFGALESIAMPTIGRSAHVLDVRNFTTPIPSTASFLTVLMDIDDGVNPAYEFEGYYDLNADGQPKSWKLPPTLTGSLLPIIPVPAYDPSTQTLTLTNPNPATGLTAAAILRGDLAEVAIVLGTGNGAITIISQAIVSTLLSPLGETLELECTNAEGTFRRRFATTTGEKVQILGAVELEAWFTGTTLVLGDVSAVDQVSSRREITVVADGPPIVIRDAQNNTIEHLNAQQSTTFGPYGRQTHVDLLYVAGGIDQRIRVYTNYFDVRSANPRAISIQPRPAWGVSGADYDNINFSFPSVRFDLSAKNILIEPDGRVWNFRAWRFENLANGNSIDFLDAPTAGRSYHVAGVLHGVSAGQKLLCVAQHRNGYHKSFTVEIHPIADGFQTPRSTTLNPLL